MWVTFDVPDDDGRSCDGVGRSEDGVMEDSVVGGRDVGGWVMSC